MNDQAPMTNRSARPLVIGHWALIGHWGLGIGHSAQAAVDFPHVSRCAALHWIRLPHVNQGDTEMAKKKATKKAARRSTKKSTKKSSKKSTKKSTKKSSRSGASMRRSTKKT